MSQTAENTIGKGTWIDKIAKTIIDREIKLQRPTVIINVESGLGASGIPHIGSLGDAVRAYGISMALQNLGYNSRLIAFSDDFDGLRKVPSGLPDWLHDHICKPVSSIPDPFGDCHNSYGDHMSGLLLEGLNASGIKYEFRSGTQTYKSGILTDQTHKILTNSQKIGNKISESTGQQKYTKYLPYFPLCENCNRLYVANALEYYPSEQKISYKCSGNIIGKKQIEGCGHNGELRLSKGSGKLAWKVEFAARWQAFDIRFEAFGKDIMDSVRINDWVSEEILNYNHPVHAKYEMFLDKGGKKISKSSGNVLTPQMWLKYGTPESLLLLLYKRISGTRHVGMDDIPHLMDEYDLYEDIYFGKVKEQNESKRIKLTGIYEYINHLKPPQILSSVHIPYRILIQQAGLFKNQNIDSNVMLQVLERLKKYGMIRDSDFKDPILQRKINLAINWVNDDVDMDNASGGVKGGEVGVENDKDSNRWELTAEQKSILKSISTDLKNLESRLSTPGLSTDATKGSDNEALAQEVQSIIFNYAKSNGFTPKEIFKLFYRILINADKGPRLGNYIVDLGLGNVIKTLDKSSGY